MYQGRLLAHLQITAARPAGQGRLLLLRPALPLRARRPLGQLVPLRPPAGPRDRRRLRRRCGSSRPSSAPPASSSPTPSAAASTTSRTGLAAAALFAASPFFLMQSSSFMSHNTGVLYILLSLYFILRRDRPRALRPARRARLRPRRQHAPAQHGWRWCRPSPSSCSPTCRRTRTAATRWQHIAAFVAGGLLMGAALLAYNYGVTGDPLTLTYAGTANDSSSSSASATATPWTSASATSRPSSRRCCSCSTAGPPM